MSRRTAGSIHQYGYFGFSRFYFVLFLVVLNCLWFLPFRGTNLGSAAADTSAASPSTTSSPSVEILLDSLVPYAPQVTDTLTVTGRLRNTGSESFPTVVLRVATRSQPLPARNAVAKPSEEILASLKSPPQAPSVVLEKLGPQEVRAFTYQIPVSLLGYSKPGVYPLRLEVVRTPADSHELLGTLNTGLPWFPTGTSRSVTPISWLWPLMASPFEHATPQVGRDPDGFHVNDIIKPGGRLDNLLKATESAGTPDELALVLDPLLIETLDAMQDTAPGPSETPALPSASAATGQGQENPAHVESPQSLNATSPATENSLSDNDRTAQNSQGAQAWLSRVKNSPLPKYVVPYADPDIAGLARSKQSDVLIKSLIRAQTISTAHKLNAPLLPWPNRTAMNRTAISFYRQALATVPNEPHWKALVTSQSALTEKETLGYTPDARGTLSLDKTSVDVLSSDDTLSGLVSSRPNENDPAMSTGFLRQKFILETAMIAVERPSNPRSILIAPEHRWNPDAQLVANMLTLSKELPWLAPRKPSSLLNSPSITAWKDFTTISDASSTVLSKSYLSEVTTWEESAHQFGDILTEPELIMNTLEGYALALRSGSLTEINKDGNGTVRTPQQRQRQAFDMAETALKAERDKVRVIPIKVTLGARSGPIPVTVINDLDQSVQLRIALTPELPRITVAKTPRVRVPGGRSSQIDVNVKSVANGPVSVEAQLQTPEGLKYGDPVKIEVQVRSIGPYGILLTVGAGVLFVIAVIARLVRRHISQHKKTAASGSH